MNKKPEVNSESELLENFRRNVIRILSQRGISQAKAARICDVAPRHLIDLLQKRATPTLATVEKLARGLQVDPLDLLREPPPEVPGELDIPSDIVDEIEEPKSLLLGNLATNMASIGAEKNIALTKARVASGISHRFWYDILQQRAMPTLTTIERIARGLKTDPISLLKPHDVSAESAEGGEELGGESERS